MYGVDLSVEHLKHERDRFVAFAFASADILVELDDDARITYADGATSGLLGKKADELIGQSFFELVHPDDRHYRNLLKDVEHAGRFEHIKVRLPNKHQDMLPFDMSGYTLSWLQHHTFLTLSLIRADIAPEELNKRDIYSGLLKKENFAQTADKRIREAEAKGEDIRVTLLDFPELKDLLDTLAPNQAAKLMGEISQYLRSKSIDGDTAGMIDENAYSFVHAANITTEQVIKDLVHLTKEADPRGVGLTMQAHTLDTEHKPLTPQDSASALLYTINRFATERGANFSIHSLEEGYESMLDDTVHKIAAFKDTVANDAFDIAFQSIVDLKSGVIHHFETLVRLKGQEDFNNPFHFITFGEQAGIIGDFDLAMCQRTLGILERAAEAGNHPLVSVNLSGKSLGSNLFMDTLNGILENSPRVRKQVIFEITESAKIGDLALANNFVQELRQAGNLCCLDDFGVGECSFDYLRNLQVDFVKIDGSYVREATESPRGKHLLKAMAGLCRSLGITTIGEMVEDERAAVLLWENGVKFGQGYFFGKPTIDETALIQCSRPTPFYNGIMRAKKVRKTKQQWWKRDA